MSSTAVLHTGEVRAGRFDPEVFVNCLQKDKIRLRFCKQLTKTSGDGSCTSTIISGEVMAVVHLPSSVVR